MRIELLEIRDLRCLREVSLAPGAGANLLTGDNGAGKTSVLEALHLLAHGRSFRGRVRDGLVRTGAPALEVFARWQDGRDRKAGLRHAGAKWEGRLDGEPVQHLGHLCAALMVVTFEPGSHALVSGSSENRRRFVDWGLFHVEQDYLAGWRRYARAHKQRNALLRAGAAGRQLDAWDLELAESGELVTARRQAYIDRLGDVLAPIVSRLAPGLGEPALAFHPGWRRQEMPLADALLVARDRDRQAGHGTVGPHRADWRLGFAAMPESEALSRGQAKLAAMSCLLAQAADCADQRGHWPVIVLDDLASELDRRHQATVAAHVAATGAQWFVSGTDVPQGMPTDVARFHVEQGLIRPA